MKQFKASTGVIVALNLKLAWAITLGTAAYWMWPTSPKWWAAGMISIMVGVSAICLMIDAVRTIFKVRAFERQQGEFARQGNQVKASQMASQNAMTKDGVIRHDR